MVGSGVGVGFKVGVGGGVGTRVAAGWGSGVGVTVAVGVAVPLDWRVAVGDGATVSAAAVVAKGIRVLNSSCAEQIQSCFGVWNWGSWFHSRLARNHRNPGFIQRLNSSIICSGVRPLASRFFRPRYPPGLILGFPPAPLVLQRQFREGCGVMPAWRRGAWHGSVWPVRYCPAYPQATAATRLARTVPGAAFPAPPGRPAAS